MWRAWKRLDRLERGQGIPRNAATSFYPKNLRTLVPVKGKVVKKLHGIDYNEATSLRIVHAALTLQEDWLREKRKRGHALRATVPAPQVRDTVCHLFGVGSATYSKIMATYLTHRDLYMSDRQGNWHAKAARLPQTKGMQILVREYVRNERRQRKRVTAKQVCDHLLEKKLLAVPMEDGIYDRAKYNTAYRCTRRWLGTQGYQRGRRRGNIVRRREGG